MPRRIILHAGFHKTGTSSVQATLKANRPKLKPVLAIRLKGQMTDLMHATRGYSTYRDAWSLRKAASRFEGLLKALPSMPRRTLLLSAEELCGHMPGRGDLRDYSAAPKMLARFVEIAQKAYPKAECLIYLSTRAPEPWLKSAWAEHVKSSSMTLDYAEFSKTYRDGADLALAVEAVQRAVPCPLHHHALEDCKDLPLGPADPLLDLCDIPPELRATLASAKDQNKALPHDVTLALLDANRAYTDKDARSAAKRAILVAAEKA